MSATQTLSYETSMPRTSLGFRLAVARPDRVELLDTGHFALETHVDEIASSIHKFLNPVR